MCDFFSPNDIDFILEHLKKPKCVSSVKKIGYFTIPISFDIETSSFYYNDSKCGTMYEFTIAITDKFVIVGRKWEEFHTIVNKLIDFFQTDETHRLIIWVHNLSYEFGFIENRFKWNNVFALEERKVLYALTENGIEFRCSYLLSGYNLETLAKNLIHHKIEKLTGDLDYSQIRLSETPLTDEEIQYCINDVLIVIYYISEQLETYKNFTRFPLTKTGVVRKYCRNNCLYGSATHKKADMRKYNRYKNLMDNLQLTPEIFTLSKQAFAGGFTHSSCFYSRKIVKNVDSFDFTSSYPAVMCAYQYPMTAGEKIKVNTLSEAKEQMKKYCCLFTIKLYGVESRNMFEHYISASKCLDLKNPIIDNGRVVSADSLLITITEIDFKIIDKMYEFKKYQIGKFYRFGKGYLPKDFILSILELYKKKTELKGVEGSEKEYLNSKELLNACYGMCVTNPVRDEIDFENGKWITKIISSESQILKKLEKYNNQKSRFLFYLWGVWVTAWARYNLISGILEFGEDYIYSDTDSIKCINVEKHMDYINRYNSYIEKMLNVMCDYYKIDKSMIKPLTKKGKTKLLGAWEHETAENKYLLFKSLGAKRYLWYDGNVLNLTVSGLDKSTTTPFLCDIFCIKHHTDDLTGETIIDDDTNISMIFDLFDDEMMIPADYTGKKTHTYSDFGCDGFIKDYLGNSAEFHEKSFVHLENAEYTLDMHSYKEFLQWVIKNYGKN